MKKYTSLETRKKIISLHKENRLTEKEIAAELDIAPSTAHYWISRHFSGDTSLSSKPKTGRPRKLNASLDTAIFETSQEDPFLPATQIRRDLNLSEQVCVQTVRNRLRARGLRCRKSAKKDYLKKVHKDKRLNFALLHSAWNEDRWKNVIFSDEKLFALGGNGRVRVWRPTDSPDRLDPKYITSTRNTEWGRLTIMVWACISAGDGNRNQIHLIDPPRGQKRTLNSKYYVREILQGVVMDKILRNDPRPDDVLLMQDNSPIHTAHICRDWIGRNRLKIVENWPPKGPDLNPIENVWAEIERILAHRQCRDKNELWVNVSQVFEDLTVDENGNPTDYVKKLIESMPRRMGEAIQREGGWTKY